MITEPTAILAWHGLGQQVPFETIEMVARVLVRQEKTRGKRSPAITPRLVKFGTEKLWRAELELTDGNGDRHPVHVYEMYWAPLTEGKITVAETVSVLLSAGLNGLRYALLPPRVLRRFLFDRWVTFSLSSVLASLYLVLLLALIALIVVNFAITTTLLVKLINGFNNPDSWPSYPLLQDLTVDFGWLALAFAVTGAVLSVAYLSQRTNWRESVASKRHAVSQMVIWFLIAVSLMTILVVGGLVAWHLVAHQFTDHRRWGWSPTVPVSIAVWVAVVAGSAIVRWFVLEFIGDAAIYVSSHKLNRFFDTREAVKNRSVATATAIYKFGGYSRHIVIGHSLGSVIAYDALNQLVNDDKLRKQPLDVTGRTRLFLTLGSVLDKTAFLFRIQSPFSDIREFLAGAVQPLISDAAARPPWVNIYSRHDPLAAGPLDYYDPIKGMPRPPDPGSLPNPVANIPDEDAWIPLIAHVQYWTNEVFARSLVEAITG